MPQSRATAGGGLQAPPLIRTLSVLALIRTSFSSERAVLSWIRTAVSLYTFGFTISKAIDYLESQETGLENATGLRRLGFGLACMGIVALLLASAEHFRRIRKLNRLGMPRTAWPSVPILVAITLAVLGLVVATTSMGVF